MYSYPAEYLLHPVPVLAIYGLSSTSNTPNDARLVDVDELAANSTEKSSSVNASPPSTRSGLASLLLSLFTSKSDYTLYEASRYVSSNQIPPPFRVITVSKDYVLPQKPPPAAPNLPPPHSHLSPLSHDSPLYPDGVMTPLWIKKHLYSPSVVVGFYDLWDWQTESSNPPRAQRETGPLASQVLIDPTEREHDTNLAIEINARRKYFQEKGIKFAAVIVFKQRYTDQSIDERLSAIRKQCGLDARSSFFTIAPGSANEIQEFVNSLYRALYEPALQFYSNRLKKIRKKKSKLPSPSQMPRTTPDLSSTEPQPLSIVGWILRYDIKAAFFHETKQEIDGALKSYEAAYGIIVEMLAPTSSITMGHVNLTVHAKRWKEARTLADCINVKICKFHLFMDDPTAALSQLNGHLHMFQSYSPTWGMGEHTFEYWAWLSKQYRIFADIIDAAIQAGYKVPLPTAYLTSSVGGATPNSPILGSTGGGITSTSGCNPGAILQHPGFYYHLAAMCCAERRRRFLEIERSDANSDTNPVLQTEKLVDHSSLTIELLTKSYEQFKRYRNGRMTLYLAAEIAGTYYETGKFEMAIKFFERIGKTYRKEKWHMVLTSILRWSLRCAKELGSWERAVECLVELMSDDLPMADNKRNDVQKELFDILNVHPAATAEKHAPLVIHMDQINAFLACQVQIKKQTNFVGAPVDYQIIVKTNKKSPPMPFRFNAVKVLFNNPQYNVILKDAGAEHEPNAVELIDFSKDLSKETDEGDYKDWYTATVDLQVFKGQIKALQGSVIPQDCGELRILDVCFDIITPQWQVELKYALDKMAEEHPASRRKWLESYADGQPPIYKILDGRGHLSAATIMQKPPSLDLKFEHAAPALLDELFKLDVTMTSSETETVEATLVAEIKNSEGIVHEDYIAFSIDNHEHAALQEADVGQIEPGKSVTKSVYLHGGNVTGSRLITITVKYSIVGKDTLQVVEKIDSLRIPFIAPFDANYELCAQSEKLKKSTAPELEKSERWLLVAALRCFSAWDLDIKHVRLEKDETSTPTNTLLSLISSMDDFDNQTWKTGHIYNANYLFRLTTSDLTEEQSAAPAGKIVIEWKRSGDQNEHYYKSVLGLPSIQFQQQGLVVVADVPSEIYLGEPFTISYTVYNPTEYLAEYNASVEISEAFVFSGYKQLKGRVLPLSRAVYHYTCYPLLAGKVKLPRLKVMASQQQSGEREVPVEVAGSGISIALDNDLQQKQTGSPSDVTPTTLLAFVNAKRRL
ncbi:glutathione transferase omega-1 [Mucor ambiguus]|uniref:Glutathione transferase omega-1 n=1 Tax=Mucor ambiguus TaxID=91626 RepID=A0A0C9MNM9_9FUNG|nr:glutathione transferase omega-1 [Mucor ambiguus]